MANKKQKMNALRLREMFMDESAEKLMRQYIDVVQGVDTFHSTNSTARVEMWDLLKHAIISTKDAQKYDAENTQEVLRSVREGKLSYQEGKEMLHLLGMQKSIDQEETPGGGLGPLGFAFFVKDEANIVAGSNVNKDPDIVEMKIPSGNTAKVSRKPDETDFEW